VEFKGFELPIIQDREQVPFSLFGYLPKNTVDMLCFFGEQVPCSLFSHLLKYTIDMLYSDRGTSEQINSCHTKPLVKYPAYFI